MIKVLIGAAGTPEPLPSQGEPMFTEHEKKYGVWDGVAMAQIASRMPVSGSVCTFWCAVAVGGLLEGRPLEAVRAPNAWSGLFVSGGCLSSSTRNRTQLSGHATTYSVYGFEGGDTRAALTDFTWLSVQS